jgi:hypothetical protein
MQATLLGLAGIGRASGLRWLRFDARLLVALFIPGMRCHHGARGVSSAMRRSSKPRNVPLIGLLERLNLLAEAERECDFVGPCK